MSADDVTERAAAVIEPYLPAMPDQLSAGIAHDAAVALRDAGLLVTDERDRAVAARALRGAADGIPVDLWCTYGGAARSHVEGVREWFRDRADRIEAGGQP